MVYARLRIVLKESGVRKRVVSKTVVPWTPQNWNKGTKNGTTVPKIRNEGTKNGTTIQKMERGYIRQNHPFTKPPFCILSKDNQLTGRVGKNG